MARQSKRQNRRALSGFLLLLIIGSVAVGVVKLRHHEVLPGLQFAFLPLALLLGFTWPTTCRVKTTRRKPCGNASYGFLFGSGKTPGHWRYKFLYRLGLQREEVIKPLQPRKRNGSYAVMYQDTPEVNPIRVTVEDNGLSVCGFWVGVVSAVAALIQVVHYFYAPLASAVRGFRTQGKGAPRRVRFSLRLSQPG